jgi:hypothetical protein
MGILFLVHDGFDEPSSLFVGYLELSGCGVDRQG